MLLHFYLLDYNFINNVVSGSPLYRYLTFCEKLYSIFESKKDKMPFNNFQVIYSF